MAGQAHGLSRPGAGARRRRGWGPRRAARAFGGPAAKMASRGFGAAPPPPPGGLREGAEAEVPAVPPPLRAGPHLRSPSHLGMERVGEGFSEGVGVAPARALPLLAGCSGPRAQITCRFLGAFSCVP